MVEPGGGRADDPVPCMVNHAARWVDLSPPTPYQPPGALLARLQTPPSPPQLPARDTALRCFPLSANTATFCPEIEILGRNKNSRTKWGFPDRLCVTGDAAAVSRGAGRWRASERAGQRGRGGMDDIVPGAAGGIPAAFRRHCGRRRTPRAAMPPPAAPLPPG